MGPGPTLGNVATPGEQANKLRKQASAAERVDAGPGRTGENPGSQR